MRKNIEIQKSAKRFGALVGLVATGAVAANVAPVQAEAPIQDNVPVVAYAHLNKHQKKVNDYTQRAVNKLAAQIINGPVDRKGGSELVQGDTGEVLDRQTVVVSAANKLQPQYQGIYTFTVLAPNSVNETPITSETQEVVLNEGTNAGDGNVYFPAYEQLIFVRTQNHSWAIANEFLDANTLSRQGYVEAETLPAMPHEAELTVGEVNASIHEAQDMIQDAIDKNPVSIRRPAFAQPQGTIQNLLK